MRGSRGGGGGGRGSGPPLENHKNIGFFSNTGPDPLKIVKLPSQLSILGHNWHASETRWRTEEGPLIVVLGQFLPHQTKKTLSKLNPL